LKNPTTTSSPGSGRKNQPRSLPHPAMPAGPDSALFVVDTRQQHFDSIFLVGSSSKPIDNANLQPAHGRQEACRRCVGNIRLLGKPLGAYGRLHVSSPAFLVDAVTHAGHQRHAVEALADPAIAITSMA